MKGTEVWTKFQQCNRTIDSYTEAEYLDLPLDGSITYLIYFSAPVFLPILLIT